MATSDDPHVTGSDGILGLRMGPPPKAPIEAKACPSFLGKLKEADIIDKLILGISIHRDNGNKGQIRFGGYNMNKMYYGTKTEIVWYDLPDNDAWELTVYEGLYGTTHFLEADAEYPV